MLPIKKAHHKLWHALIDPDLENCSLVPFAPTYSGLLGTGTIFFES